MLNPELALDEYDPRGTATWNLIDWEKIQNLDPGIHRFIEYIRKQETIT